MTALVKPARFCPGIALEFARILTHNAEAHRRLIVCVCRRLQGQLNLVRSSHSASAYLIAFCWHSEHHVQEVGCIGQVVPGIDERLTCIVELKCEASCAEIFRLLDLKISDQEAWAS